MYDRELVLEQIDDVLEAIRRIERRFEPIEKPHDFVANDEGIDRLDAIAMMLIAIGELIKKIDNATEGTLLARLPEIPWPGIMGTRDILAHDYFGIDPEEIFSICARDLKPLKVTMHTMKGLA